MPNWCDNILIITGKPEALMKFMEENREIRGLKKREEEVFPEKALSKLSFMRTLPTPEEFRGQMVGSTGRDMEEAFGSKKPTNWYTWQIRYWGTKWDASGVHVYRAHRPERLVYTFETAWSPPVPWTEHVAGKYQHLKFELRFSEGGCNFSGVEKFRNGVVVNPDHHEDDYRPLRYPSNMEEIK